MHSDLATGLVNDEDVVGAIRAGSKGYNVVQYAPATRRSSIERMLSGIGPGAQRSSMMNLVMTAIGSGVLALPWAFSTCGLPLSSVMLALGGMASYQSLKLLANAGYATGRTNYSAVVEEVLGQGMSFVLQAILFVFAFGATVGYFVFIGSMGPSMFEQLGAPAFMHERKSLLMALGLFPVFPMCCVRKIGSFRFLSMLSIAFMVILMLFIVVTCPINVARRKVSWENVALGNISFKGWLSSSAIIIFSYCCHLNMFASSFEMNDATPLRVNKILRRSVMAEFGIYFFVGAGGALSFGDSTSPIVLNSYAPDDVAANIVRCLVICALLVVIPLNMFGARGVIYDCFTRSAGENTNWQPPLLMHILVSGGLLAAAVAISVFVQDVVGILGLIGGAFAVTFMFVLPMWTANVLQTANMYDDCNTIGRSTSRRLLIRRMCFLGAVSFVGYAGACQSFLTLCGLMSPLS